MLYEVNPIGHLSCFCYPNACYIISQLRTNTHIRATQRISQDSSQKDTSNMQLSVTLLICVIATCIMTTCRCFFISNKIQASTNNVLFTSSKPICMVSKNSYNEGALTIEKRILHSIISFGVALTAFSISSNAIDLPMTYTSEDKSIVFKHTEDLQFSPKPLKTHDKEILLKSELIKGFNAGVTVSVTSTTNDLSFTLITTILPCHSYTRALSTFFS